MTSGPQLVSQTSQPQACRHRSARSCYLAFRKRRRRPLGYGLVSLLALMPRVGGCQPVRHRQAAGYRCRDMRRDWSPTVLMLRCTSADSSLAFTGQESGV